MPSTCFIWQILCCSPITMYEQRGVFKLKKKTLENEAKMSQNGHKT